MNKQEIEKFILGETFEEATRIPTLQEVLEKHKKQMKSGYPLFSLGVGTNGEFSITEEERENHFHVLGTTGEGKSKLLELMCRYDIDNGNPFLFLDSSAQGKTAFDILKYCAYKKKKNVIFIDPKDFYAKSKVIGMNPFIYYDSLEDGFVENIFDTIKVVFNTKDESETPMISKYLPEILHVLFKAKATLYEAQYFTDRDDEEYKDKRNEIFAKVLAKHPNDYPTRSLINAYNPSHRTSQTESTARRLNPLFNKIIAYSLAKEGLDFPKIIREKYSIIVNLGTWRLGPMQRKLIGTLLINALDFTIDRMRDNGWKGVYYMYIDEAQEYATKKLGDILARKRKNGLRLIIAHHHLGQIEDKRLQSDINNLTKTKIAFHIPDPDERMRVVKTFFGGALADRDVHYVLGQQAARKCAVKKGKEEAVIIKTLFVPEVKADVESYLDEIYEQPFYFSPKEIRDEINSRFPIAPKDDQISSRRTQSNNRTTGKTDGGKTQHSPKESKDSGKPKDNRKLSDRVMDELFAEAERLKKID